jgi:hypothetical protein
MLLDDVTIGITSLLRFGYLKKALADIKENFPECKVIVADDSDTDPPITTEKLIKLPFDSGISKKRNAAVKATETKYWLCGTDDHLFDKKAREGVEKMKQFLEQYPMFDVAAGRCNGNEYEGYLEYEPGEYIREIPLSQGYIGPIMRGSLAFPWHEVSITANYFLARTDKIEPWEESLKIGGEHVMWFLKMREHGKRIAWIPGAEIVNQPYFEGIQDPRYNRMRMRCWDGHAEMKRIMNIKDYIGFDGSIS